MHILSVDCFYLLLEKKKKSYGLSTEQPYLDIISCTFQAHFIVGAAHFYSYLLCYFKEYIFH